MKKPYLTAIVTFIMLSMIHVPLFADSNKPFVIADDGSFGPFSYMDEQGQFIGIFPELYTEAFKRIQVPLSYGGYPWRRAQQMIRDGEADAMITIPTPKRLEHLTASKPLFTEPFVIWARKDNPRIDDILKIQSIPDLKGFYIIELQGNGWAETHLAPKELGLSIIWVSNNVSIPKMLILRRGDIAVMPQNVTIFNISQKNFNNADALLHSDYPLGVNPFCLMVRNDSKYIHILPQFNKAIKEMREDGTFEIIVNRHLNGIYSLKPKSYSK